MNGQTYEIRFFLEHGGSSPLWSKDDNTREKFGYEIDLEDLKLSKKTLELTEYIFKIYEFYLNPIYQPLPSFWSPQMNIFFQHKVNTLLEQIRNELKISNNYEIVQDEYFLSLTDTNIKELDLELKTYLNNPYKYLQNNGVLTNMSEQQEYQIVSTLYDKWLDIEEKILQNKFFVPKIDLFEMYLKTCKNIK